MIHLDGFRGFRSIALIGASREERKIGHGMLRNIVESGFPGAVYPVNPKADRILGLACYPAIGDVPGEVDLAIIVLPAPLVVDALRACGEKGVRHAIVVSGGFRESGPEGAARERELLEVAHRHGIRFLGPNCVGLIDTELPVNATFVLGMPARGTIAVASQSGAICGAILDWANAQRIGFSRFVSLGNKADITESDLLEAWANDDATRVIGMYLEDVRDGPRFLRAAAATSRRRPVVVIKGGRTAAGRRAVLSHTGSLAGEDAAYDAAFRQAGVMRVDSIEDLFDVAAGFSEMPPLRGDRVAILTNAGGPGIMATDAVERGGLALAVLSPETTAALLEILPPAGSARNPVDLTGSSDAEIYARCLDLLLADDGVDACLVLFVPQVVVPAEEVAGQVAPAIHRHQKPVFTSLIGQATIGGGVKVLNDHGLRNFTFPERSVAALAGMRRYALWRARPAGEPPRFEFDEAAARETIAAARAAGRPLLDPTEVRRLLAACGFHQPGAALVTDAEAAVAAAERIGYPVAVKVASADVVHKSDVGGVRLGVTSAASVRDAVREVTAAALAAVPGARIDGALVQGQARPGTELLLGVSRDPVFGPLVGVGLGGIFTEALRDVAFRIAPLTRGEAEAMLDELRAAPVLAGMRGQPAVDRSALVDAVCRLARLAADHPEVREIDINPLRVYGPGEGALALDARVILGAPGPPEAP